MQTLFLELLGGFHLFDWEMIDKINPETSDKHNSMLKGKQEKNIIHLLVQFRLAKIHNDIFRHKL